MIAGGGTQSEGSEGMSEGWSFLTLVRAEASTGPFSTNTDEHYKQRLQ